MLVGLAGTPILVRPAVEHDGHPGRCRGSRIRVALQGLSERLADLQQATGHSYSRSQQAHHGLHEVLGGGVCVARGGSAPLGGAPSSLAWGSSNGCSSTPSFRRGGDGAAGCGHGRPESKGPGGSRGLPCRTLHALLTLLWCQKNAASGRASKQKRCGESTWAAWPPSLLLTTRSPACVSGTALAAWERPFAPAATAPALPAANGLALALAHLRFWAFRVLLQQCVELALDARSLSGWALSVGACNRPKALDNRPLRIVFQSRVEHGLFEAFQPQAFAQPLHVIGRRIHAVGTLRESGVGHQGAVGVEHAQVRQVVDLPLTLALALVNRPGIGMRQCFHFEAVERQSPAIGLGLRANGNADVVAARP